MPHRNIGQYTRQAKEMQESPYIYDEYNVVHTSNPSTHLGGRVRRTRELEARQSETLSKINALVRKVNEP